MSRGPHHPVPLLTPAVALAWVVVVPWVVACDVARQGSTHGSTMAWAAADRADNFVQCVQLAARELFKHPVTPLMHSADLRAMQLDLYGPARPHWPADTKYDLDLPTSLTSLPPPL